MARDRAVNVRLRASVSEFTGPLGKAKDAVDGVVTSAKGAGGALAQAARENREAWSTVGTGLTAYGAAVTGLGAAVLGVGISYNTLRQRSVAALTTLTGSAQAANAQMDKLDDFASNSPFARDVFIKAQQQLIGFGMEAEKVIPTLDAIQNAVAATGGSNQDIEELVRIIAQVGAAGKITATDLMQFGQRGVDAATLIGSQMGKTGQQIRSEITAGTLDADAAIQALTDGMNERFGGAAANVKGTMLGATDRVKAAFRDISASFASILVDPEGGGLLVDGLNSLADAMRTFEDLPAPIRNTALALGLTTGPLALAAGGFLLLAPRIVDTWDALGRMGRVGTIAQDGLKKIGGAAVVAGKALGVAGLVLALSAAGNAMNDFGFSTEEAKQRLIQFGNTAALSDLLNLDLSKSNFSQSLRELSSDSAWRGIHSGLAGIGDGLGALAGLDTRSEFYKMRDGLASVDGALAQMAGESLPSAAEKFAQIAAQTDGSRETLEALIKVMPNYADAIRAAASEQGIALTDAQLLDIALGNMGLSATSAAVQMDSLGLGMEGAAVSADAAETAVDEYGEEVNQLAEDAAAAKAEHEALVDSLLRMVDSAFGAQNAAIAYESSLDSLTAAVKENGKTHDISTEAGRANQKALLDVASSAVAAAEANLTNGDSLFSVTKDMQKARAEFVKGAIQMGYTEKAANDLADDLGLTDGQVVALSSSIGDLKSKTVTVDVNGTGTATSNVEKVRSKIAALSGKTVYVNVVTNYESRGQMPANYRAHVGLADGGPVFGPGTATSDSIPAMLSNNEHVLTAREVAAAGGHGEVYRLRKALLAGTARYDIGGAMGAGYADRYAQMRWSAPAPQPSAASGATMPSADAIGAAVASHLGLDSLLPAAADRHAHTSRRLQRQG